MENKWQKFILFLLLVLYGYLLAQKINLATADLGRHLKNGELFFKEQTIPKTNLYSYTYPDYLFINHHWGSGVVFYLVKIMFGFKGLSLFFITLSLVTFLIFFNLAWKNSSFKIATLLSIIFIPVIASRIEIRPEVFSYLLSAVFLWITINYKNNKISSKYLYILPFLELIWVNLHIYFPLGIFIIGAVLLEVFRKPEKVKKLGVVLVFSSLFTFLNPAGAAGALLPLRIFDSYGYRLVENQTVWFIEKLITYPQIRYFKIGFIILILSWLYAIYKSVKKKKQLSVANLIFTIFFSILGWTAIRNFTIFGYFSLPIAAINFRSIKKAKAKTTDDYFLLTILSFVLVLFIIVINQPFWSSRKINGFGLREGMQNSANFFKKNKIKGPIFNNYDLGGYLIYHLYPKTRVFVDNRPEAYPVRFFEKVYIPMQEDNKIFKRVDSRYNFNAIFFYRHDATPWGQKFLIDKISDPLWAAVYIDDYNIIFLKRNNTNKLIINNFELPQEIFSIRNPD